MPLYRGSPNPHGLHRSASPVAAILLRTTNPLRLVRGCVHRKATSGECGTDYAPTRFSSWKTRSFNVAAWALSCSLALALCSAPAAVFCVTCSIWVMAFAM